MTVEKINLKGMGGEVELGVLSSFVSKGGAPQTMGRRADGAEKPQVEGSSSILIPSSTTGSSCTQQPFMSLQLSHAYPILTDHAYFIVSQQLVTSTGHKTPSFQKQLLQCSGFI